MLPNPTDLLPVVRALAAASQGLAMEGRSAFQTQFVLELCRDSLPRCRQVLDQLPGDLAAEAVLALEKVRNELTEASTPADSAKKPRHFGWALPIAASFRRLFRISSSDRPRFL
jgi:hypothetical protein